MSTMNCSKDTYSHKDRCCKRCPAGQYVKADCEAGKSTECVDCKDGFFTATKNHMKNCQVCSDCSSHPNLRTAKNCTTMQDTECECETGFYCSNKQCDHCQRLTLCPVGKGVKKPATRTSDTVCAPCEEGTYSNVTDFLSPCKAHTKCEVLGRTVETKGTQEADAICGDIIRCSWKLPAGLWSGLVLTAFILFIFVICRRTKRRSYRAAGSSDPVTLVETARVTPLELPLPSTELYDPCPESCPVEECKLPLFNPDDKLVSCSVDSSLPITPLKASVSFAESNHNNGSAGYRTSNFLRTYSEPQEDEWCGT